MTRLSDMPWRDVWIHHEGTRRDARVRGPDATHQLEIEKPGFPAVTYGETDLIAHNRDSELFDTTALRLVYDL